jgi:hypothetical protein
MWSGKLKQIVADLGEQPDKLKANELWKSAGSTLQRTGVDKMRAARVVAMKDYPGLKAIVAEVEKNPQLAVQTRYVPSKPTVFTAPVSDGAAGAAAATTAAPTLTAPAEPAAPPSDGDLTAALKAFRKRLKVTQLDEQSKIVSREITGGRRASVVAISPPNQFPRAVWEALVERGKLRRAGSGLYELTDN